MQPCEVSGSDTLPWYSGNGGSWALDIKYLLSKNLHRNSPVGLYARIDEALYIILVLYLSLPLATPSCSP